MSEEEVDPSRLDIAFESIFDKSLVIFGVFFFIISLALTMVQVAARFLPIFESLPWTVPLARFTFIIMTFFGAAVAARNEEHISIGIVLERLSGKYPQQVTGLKILGKIITILFLSVTLVGLGMLVIQRWGTPVGGVTGITSGYIYLGIGIGIGSMIIYYMMSVIYDVESLKNSIIKKGGKYE
jgi:TRAP-type C4-dicarboxylate transport system permease small subunit